MAYISIKSPRGILQARVDDEDADLAEYSWSMAGGKGNVGKYAATGGFKSDGLQTVYMHRLIAHRMGLIDELSSGTARGTWQLSIDHANGDKLDNRRSNLRLRNRSQQMKNPADGLRATNTSGYRGVSYCKTRERLGKPWTARVTEDRKSITLGWFATAEEAGRARQSYDEAPDKAAWRAANRQPRRLAVSGYEGVTESDSRFYAHVTEDGQRVSLGGYDTAQEAAAARQDYLASDDKAAWLAQIKARPQSNGSSGYRGVTFLKQVRERQWYAHAVKDGQRYNLGRYDTVEEAAAARRAWELQMVSETEALAA